MLKIVSLFCIVFFGVVVLANSVLIQYVCCKQSWRIQVLGLASVFVLALLWIAVVVYMCKFGV